MKTWVLAFLLAVPLWGTSIGSSGTKDLGFPNIWGPVYKVGDKPANHRWYDAKDVAHDLSLTTSLGKVAVLVHNAGWCGPCNAEFKDLVPASDALGGKDVTFFSISCDGWRQSSGPTAAFLQEWDDKHGMSKSKAEWIVVGAPRDCGREYFTSPSIPNVEIIDTEGTLAFKGVGVSPAEIIRQVKKVLK